MKRLLIIPVLALTLVGPLAASMYDGSKPMICASTVTHDCGSFGPCIEGPPRAIGMPEFFRVDVGAKTIIVKTAGEKRTSAIALVNKADDRLALQGYENGYAWAMEIMGDDGEMVVTAAGDGVGFVIHGACIVP